MYCVQCGIKLADCEKDCPLCGTTVYHPHIKKTNDKPLFPVDQHPSEASRSLIGQFIATLAFVLALITVLLCDVQVNRTVTWSGYVIGALCVSYTIAVLPSWFRNPNPVIFVPSVFAAITLYLLYINLATQGDWFLSFAFPVVCGLGIVITTVVTLLRYIKRGRLFIVGGALVATGAYMPVIELLSTITFRTARFIGWSWYPLAALVLFGGLLIFFRIYPPARESMHRKFFF